jgi:hypothetical protein
MHDSLDIHEPAELILLAASTIILCFYNHVASL